MTRFSEAHGRKIVSLATAESVGKVDGFVVDPSTRTVRALTVKKADAGDTLPWPAITAFGADAVTVAAADRIGAADAETELLGGKDRKVLGKRVLTTAGDEIGEVKDVEFDPDTAAVTALDLGDEQVAGERLVGIGSYAVVVQAE